MQQSAKQLADHINKILNDLGASINSRERAAMLSKMLDIPKQQAWSLLEGQILPDDFLLKKICIEFEIDTNAIHKE